MLDKTKTDPKLGALIQARLLELGVHTPATFKEVDQEKVTRLYSEILQEFGFDLNDDSLCDTPSRLAKMYKNELFWGLNPDNFPKITVVENKMGYRNMVLERNIQVSSVCEHHFQPIDGFAHVAYIPKNKVVGLSKLNRVVEYFSRRPQVQERLTEQIFHALSTILETRHVAVRIAAKHFCVKARGIQDMNSDTVTSRLGGAFYDEKECRAEFLSLMRD